MDVLPSDPIKLFNELKESGFDEWARIGEVYQEKLLTFFKEQLEKMEENTDETR